MKSVATSFDLKGSLDKALSGALFVAKALAVVLLFFVSCNVVDHLIRRRYILGRDWNICSLEDAFSSIRCASFKVPLDWDNPTGTKINYRLRKAGAAKPERLVILLTGGPGGHASTLDEDAKRLVSRHPEFVVFIPQHRGLIGSSLLSCPNADERRASDKIRDLTQEQKEEIERECKRETLSRHGSELRFYTSEQAGRDLQLIADQFPGIPISILGTSYGTIWAQRYLQTGPSRVDSVVLASPAIAGEANLDSRDYRAPIRQFLTLCNKSSYCAEKVGFKTEHDLLNYVSKVNDGEECSRMEKSQLETIYHDVVWWFQFGRSLAMTPKFIEGLRLCSPSVFEAMRQFDRHADETNRHRTDGYSDPVPHILFQNIACSEFNSGEKPPPRDAALLQSCEGFPRYPVKPRSPVLARSPAKFLILSGLLDTSTTPEAARRLAHILGRDKTLLVEIEDRAHDPLSYPWSADADVRERGKHCYMDAVADFFVTKKWIGEACIKILPPAPFLSAIDPEAEKVLMGLD